MGKALSIKEKLSLIDGVDGAKEYRFDAETGEYKGELMYGDKILRKKSAEYLENTVPLNINEPYVKHFTRTSFQLARALTGTEQLFIDYLVEFIRFESGLIAFANGKPLTRKKMAEDTGLNVKTVDNLLRSLRLKQVISKNKMGQEVQYFMNPYLFMRGQRINKTLVDMFRNSRWAKMY